MTTTTSNQGDEMESKVTVGSRVTCTALPGYSGELLQVLPGNRLEIRWTDTKGSVHTDRHWEVRNIGGALRIDAVPAPVDWRRWLSPHPLPTLPDVVGIPSQVWACWCAGTSVVFRLGDAKNKSVVLASTDTWGVGELCGLSAEGGATILVQDVNEPHPRDPATLWGGKAAPLEIKGLGAIVADVERAQKALASPRYYVDYDAKATPPAPAKPKCHHCGIALQDGQVGVCQTCDLALEREYGAGSTAKPKCIGCDQERDLGVTGKCWDCYVVDDKEAAKATDWIHSKRITRTLMQPATLDPLWQRNPGVGVWRLR